MAIDISCEQPIPFSQAAAHVPRRRQGRKTSVATIHRWATVGLRGIRLEALQVGGTRCTTVQALQRFFDRLSAVCVVDAHATDSAKCAKRRIDWADQELDQRWQRTSRRQTGSSRAE